MTRAEYLEYVQEALDFPSLDSMLHLSHHGECVLRDTPQVCQALKEAHELYCQLVEATLFPERFDEGRLKVLRMMMDSKVGSEPGTVVEAPLRHMSPSEIMVESVKFAEGLNRGHGHVNPRPDGYRARCGGPGICAVCSQEKYQQDLQGIVAV